MTKKIKLVIIDDHQVVQLGLKKFFDTIEDMEVTGEASNANDAIRLINGTNPDIAIIDISLKGDINGLELTKSIKARFSTKIIILSMHNEFNYIEKALSFGADGYVTKDDPSDLLVEAIRQVMGGSIYLTPQISNKMINKIYSPAKMSDKSDAINLSGREMEILKLIGSGYSTGEMAKMLNISSYTIESHRRNLKDKLKVKNGSALLKWAIQWAKENRDIS